WRTAGNGWSGAGRGRGVGAGVGRRGGTGSGRRRCRRGHRWRCRVMKWMILARVAFPCLLTVRPACGTGDGAGPARNPDAAADAAPVSSEPREWISLVDRSASRPPHMVGEGQGFIERLIDTIG